MYLHADINIVLDECRYSLFDAADSTNVINIWKPGIFQYFHYGSGRAYMRYRLPVTVLIRCKFHFRLFNLHE